MLPSPRRRDSRRAATGLVRTVVVGSATFCMLLVCFALYRMSLREEDLTVQPPQPRLPEVRTEPFPAVSDLDDTQEGGIEVGAGVVGPAQDIRLTIYPREGTRASLELEVRDWMPRPGSADEFVLDQPTVRTRTKDGHAIRVRARRGVLEAKRQPGGRLDPRRGRLEGDVAVEYDRLTLEQREARGDAADSPIDPAEILTIQAGELEFDFEFAKLAIPGRLTLTAREVELAGEGLEVRFNEAAGRMESLRIDRGGRIDLRGDAELLGFAAPGVGVPAAQTVTLGAWIHKLVEASSGAAEDDAAVTERPGAAGETEAAVVTTTEDGIPVFRSDRAERPAAREPVRYLARFHEGVDLRQFDGDVLQAEVVADVLEILRNLGGEDSGGPSRSGRMSGPATPPEAGTADATLASTSRIVLTWEGPLAVEAVSDAGAAEAAQQPSRFTFIGRPVRMRSTEGDARCDELTFLPEASEVRLTGERDAPFILGSADRGTISGLALTARQEGDLWHVRVTGPGRVRRALPEPAGSVTIPSSPGVSTDVTEWQSSGAEERVDVTFAERMDAVLREITKTTVGLSGTVTSRTFRILEHVSFEGGARIRQDQTTLESRLIELAFRQRHGWGTVEAAVDRVIAQDDVLLVQNEDRIFAGRLEVEMVADASGESRPGRVTALGKVNAVQGSRRITASDRIQVGLGKAQAGASGNAGPQEAGTGKIAARDILALGDVTVTDPNVGLEVSADRLKCTLDGAGALETVVVESAGVEPASVQHRGLGVAGREVHLDVLEETADVPGAGRLTFQSFKDLNGERLREPIPVTIHWDRSMTYRGKENRAVFVNRVHLESETRSATFDCDDRLTVEFSDVVAEAPARASPLGGWGLLGDAWAELAAQTGLSSGGGDDQSLQLWGSSDGSQRRVAKEPTYILATGNAVAVMAEHEPTGGALVQRARLAGPRLSVSLREQISKLLIEGAGNLVLEDLRRPDRKERTSAPPAPGNLFAAAGAGPSKTLIQWQEAMWYDFNIDQTRFEGQVELKHFSGAALAELFGSASTTMTDGGAGSDEVLRLAPGRSTFLSCDALTVDFVDRAARRSARDKQRLGALGTSSMRRFEAAGAVALQDEVEGLALWTDRLVFEQERQILAIYGSALRQARLVLQTPGKAPRDLRADRMIYELSTGEVELIRPLATGR